MKFLLSAFTLFSLFLTGSAQAPYNRQHPLPNRQHPRQNRQHPLRNRQPPQPQQSFNSFLNFALLFGLDFNDIMAFQALSSGQTGFGNFGLGNYGPPVYPVARQMSNQNLNTLTALGLIDGPDVPDAPPVKAKAKGKGRRRGGPKPAAVKGEAGATGGEAPEGAPAKKPRRRGPRRGRKKAAKTATAKK